jgi:hypothetical protein
MTPCRFTSTLVASLLALGLSACTKQEIKTYKVAKEKTPPNAMGQMPAGQPSMDAMPAGHPQVDGMPAGHPPVNQGSAMGQAPVGGPQGADTSSELVWTAPAGWSTKPLGQMRKGSYGIKGAQGESDLSIFVFPGAAGGLVDNINRWRGQIGLQPIDKAVLADSTSTLRTDAGLEMIVVDMTGQGDERIIGSILSQGTQSWFFKLKGPSPLLATQKDEFLAFLKTVKSR